MFLQRYGRRMAVAFPLLFTVACDESARSAVASTEVDSAGVRIISSIAPAWGERGLYVDSVPVLRIGNEEPGPFQFSFVPIGLLLPGGEIAVAELSTNEIRLFDSQGRHLRSVGRRGQGPGEFQAISGLFAERGDSLVAYDQVQRRATIVPLSGGEVRVVRSQAIPRTRGSFAPFGAFSGGRLVLYNPGSGFRPDLAPGLQWDTTEVVVIEPADGASRLIARLPSRQLYVLPGGDRRVLAPAHVAVMATTRDGFYWGSSDRYELRYFDADGVLRRILRRPTEARAVDAGMIRTWIADQLAEVRKHEGEAAISRYQQSFDEAAFGERVPLFERAFVDGDGQLWIGSSDWPSPRSAPVRWSVFGTSGGWLGDLEVPAQLQVLDSRNGLVLGVWQEDGEAPFVQVHRLLQR